MLRLIKILHRDVSSPVPFPRRLLPQAGDYPARASEAIGGGHRAPHQWPQRYVGWVGGKANLTHFKFTQNNFQNKCPTHTNTLILREKLHVFSLTSTPSKTALAIFPIGDESSHRSPLSLQIQK